MSLGADMEYLKFFELGIEPFQNDPDGRFYFESASQRRARLWLQRGIQQRKGLCVVVGGPGCGKTTLAHQLLESLGDQSYCASLLSISHAECANGWLLPHVAQCFGVRQPGPDAPGMIEQIQHELVSALGAGRLPVLLVDEAQLLSNAAVMEEFRGLLNLAHGGRKTLSILLFGLPELSSVLKLDAPLAQRVEIRCDLGALPRDETLAYVKHRLECAGGATDIFTGEALDAIHKLTGGIPRLVNTLADNALFEGFIERARPVDVSLVAACAEQLELAAPAESAAPELGPNDFSMGSVVRAVEPAPAPAPAPAPEPAPALEPPKVAKPAPRQAAPPEPEADDEDELEIELEVASPTPAPAPEPAAAEAEPVVEDEADEDEPFDPGELLLEDDDDNGEVVESVQAPEPEAAAEPEPESEAEELDGLFESIQVE